mgnify:CR=1 FL=1
MTRRESREQAFALVFESSFHDEGLDYILENAADGRDLELDVSGYAKILTETVLYNRDEIDKKISEASTNWKTSRMSRVALAILRVAVCEIYKFDDVPDSVSINEAVELAKTYGGDEDPAFVNGVLGAVYKKKQEAPDVGLSGD